MTLRLTCVNHPASEAPAVRCAYCLRPFCRDCVRPRGTFYYCTSCEPAGKVEPRAAPSPARASVEPTLPATASGESAVAAASAASRIGAFAVDAIIVTVAASFALGVFRARDETAQFLIASAIALAYEAIFVQRMAKTPGKALLGIEVVGADGGAASDAQAWTRGILKIGQLGCCGATFLVAILTRERRAVHDLISGTRVVRGLRGGAGE